eukprot:15340234-Ditylum_brightwellii.AAC.1
MMTATGTTSVIKTKAVMLAEHDPLQNKEQNWLHNTNEDPDGKVNRGNVSPVKFPGGKLPEEPPRDKESQSLETSTSWLSNGMAKTPKHFKDSIDAVTTLQLSMSTEDHPEMSALILAERIKLKGAATTKQSTEIVTTVTIKFIVPKMTKVFPICKAFTNLMTNMKSAEPKLHISVKGSKSKWTIADIPGGTKFEEKLTATFSTNARESDRATLKFNLYTTEHLSKLKYSNQ